MLVKLMSEQAEASSWALKNGGDAPPVLNICPVPQPETESPEWCDEV